MNKNKLLKMKRIDSFYDNRIVNKPWGYEYVVYRNLNHLSITLLSIDYNKTTSLHCHPQKKSGFILLGGKALFQLGALEKTLRNSFIAIKAYDCKGVISFN